MKIAHVIVGLGTGGAESMLYKLLQFSKHSNNQVCVISLTNKGVNGKNIERLGVPVYTLGLELGGISFQAFYRLVKLLHKLKPDLVQGWMYHANIAILLALIFPTLHYKMVWNIRHALHHLSSEKKLTRILIKLGAVFSFLPSQIVFNSHTALSQHRRRGYIKRNMLVIPNGFDSETFRPNLTAKKEMLASLNLPKKTKLIGIVARFHEAKGYKFFVEAAGKVARQNKEVHFILVGKQVDVNNNKLGQWIEKAKYKDRFHLLGEQQNVSEIIPSFQILINSSTTESFPNVIGEAMACAVPCVATDVGDSKKIISDCGVTVQPKNSTELANAMLMLLSWDDGKFQALCIKARNRIIEKYSIDYICDEYEKMYCNLIG